MINKPFPFKGLNIGIPIIIPFKGRGFINQGSTLGFRVCFTCYPCFDINAICSSFPKKGSASQPLSIPSQTDPKKDP